MNKVLYLAAHGGFDGQAVALGGGAAIFNLLVRQWTGRAPFLLEQVTPAILGEAAPAARDLTRFSEIEYARFCRAFSQAATARVLQEDPSSTAVLVNDVSEGPDFERLAAAGFRIATIYHVDVVAYIARIYLRGAVAPWSLTRLWRALETAGLSKAAPRILKLIFSQQAASVRFSRHLIVPSSGMKLTLRRCYPRLDPARVCVLPWGCPPADYSREDAHREALKIRTELGVPDDACVVLALSRISPEKGQDLLLRALLDWERRGLPSRPIWVFICGEAAFMQGARFEQKLRAMAGRLRKIRVLFPGFVTGTRKAGFLSLAGVYVFPSRHESYGLTLMEAMAAGLPSLSLEHDGSRESLPDGCGVMIRQDDSRGVVKALSAELEALINDLERRAQMGRNAALSARLRPFSIAADNLARLLLGENT